MSVDLEKNKRTATKRDMGDYFTHDRSVWESIFASMPEQWYDAPPSDAMDQCGAYFAAHPCRRLLDLGCGFGRWAHALAGHGVGEVVGVDYAERGVRAGRSWARRSGFNARFVAASAMALPFRQRPFDGLLAAVILDNLSRSDCARAVREVSTVVRPGARGFFVFNPVLTEAQLAAVPSNPTEGCMHVTYDDAELRDCLPGWSIGRLGRSAEGFRLIEARFRAEP